MKLSDENITRWNYWKIISPDEIIRWKHHQMKLSDVNITRCKCYQIKLKRLSKTFELPGQTHVCDEQCYSYLSPAKFIYSTFWMTKYLRGNLTKWTILQSSLCPVQFYNLCNLKHFSSSSETERLHGWKFY